jgi:hypothetical protein
MFGFKLINIKSLFKSGKLNHKGIPFHWLPKNIVLNQSITQSQFVVRKVRFVGSNVILKR